jgi:2,5-diketo-D-gluconate reductase B
MPLSPTKVVRGVAVPAIGYGTWQVTGRDAREGVTDALRAGYRHIDTAAAYGNEREVGAGLRDSGVPREDVWLTSKVWMNDLRRDLLRHSAERSLRLLGVDRLDLLLIHWPPEDGTFPEAALQELVRLRDEGLIRELGVSNFPPELLRRSLQVAPVFADQVEYHAQLAQPGLLALAEEHDVLIEAYAPLGSGQSGLLEDEPIVAAARAHRATPAQVALAWLLQQPRVVALPRSTDAGRRRENLAALDVELTPEEVAAIDALAAGRRRYFDPSFAPAWD